MKKNKGSNITGLVLLAKKNGLTSFSSLWSVKHALKTEKVGHTGTLDSFADGLLVVLTGRLTHLVPHITSFTKTYLALVCFGKETDTLDPTGKVIKRGSAPSRKQVEDILATFTGPLLQKPPAFSALHVGGKRASDLARNGQDVNIEPRQIFVYKNSLIDFKEASENDPCSYAILEIQCSKGTYIRALARDIGEALQSPACLSALRRTQVGPFKLSDAAFAKDLPPFDMNLIAYSPDKKKDNQDERCEIRKAFSLFTPELAKTCGLKTAYLKKDFESYLENGRPLKKKMLELLTAGESKKIALFFQDGIFAGMVEDLQAPSYFYRYSFIAPREKKSFYTFTLEDIMNDNFPLEFIKRGTALSVGAFDGLHRGHRTIIEQIKGYKNLVKGLVTFTSPFKAESKDYFGNVLTLEQKIEEIKNFALDFVLVIDFSPEFSKIEGNVFILTLIEKMGMKVLVEGMDFSCGYKGALNMQGLALLAKEKNFDLCQVPDSFVDGEKVSSSSIRNYIRLGDLKRAALMLGDFFTLDCKSVKWTFRAGKAEAKIKTSQLVPCDGTYKVLVEFPEDAEEDSVELKAVSCRTFSLKSLHTDCLIKDGRLSLFLPSQAVSDRVQAIKFI